MGSAAWGEAARIAGRVGEQQLLRAVIGGSVEGSPCTVFVHGEAGVGKTRLVAAQAELAHAAGHAVLWGRCLRFGAGSSAYLPFVTAFEGWLGEVPVEQRDALVAATPGLGELLPSYGGPGASDSQGRVLAVIDRAVAHLASRGPVLLVVDDLQWADVSSLDALAYLIAGPRHQPVSVLVTYRDEGIPEGDLLHSWLADMARMPGVVDVPLARLDRDETAEQLADLLGATPQPSLVDEVWERSGGNAYLTELLARDLDPRAVSLPGYLPHALRTALLARWHSLPPRSRAVTQVLAVAGRPVDPAVVAAVDGQSGVERALHVASTAGVIWQDRSGMVWFRHPLLAEVLYSTLLPEEARQRHQAFVEVLSARTDQDPRSHADLALHLLAAAEYDKALGHLLRAADEASAIRAYPEAAALRRRATEVWDQVSQEARQRHGPLTAMLADSAQDARLAGDPEGALAELDRALPLLDPEHDPVTAARVMRLRSAITWVSGSVVSQPLEEMRAAAAVSARAPDSAEHALCLAELADAELWSGDRDAARDSADLAVDAARRSGDLAALSFALGSWATTRIGEADVEAEAREALSLAERCGRPEYVALAAVALANVLEDQGRIEEAADVLAAGQAAGPSSSQLTGLLGAYACSSLVLLGRFTEARAAVREVLASRPYGIAAIQARETAMILALRAGELREAEAHLDRLHDLAEHFEDYPGLHGPGALAEYLLATGRPLEALAMLLRTIEAHASVEAKYGDTLLLWGARAASEVGGPRGKDALRELVAARARCEIPAFVGGDSDPLQKAVQALFEAESARCHHSPDAVDRWRTAVRAAEQARLRYAAAEGRLRLAEALLADHCRPDAAVELRSVHEAATEMGAVRLRDEVAGVARAARISLEQPVVPAQGNGRGDHLLTAREREVLAHLVTGRSYGEIARALFISEKTVSVHVSNVLRKTGTSSRVEAAAWALRTGAAPAP